MMIKTILLFVAVGFLTVGHSAKFPSKWKKCPKKDNEECLKESIASALADLKDGNKDLNVIPMDPLHFNRMEMNQGGQSPVNINLTFYDLDIIGASRVKINEAKIDWDNYDIKIDLDVINGPAYLLGDYTIGGKVLVLPIRGKGKSNITLEDFSVLIELKGSESIRNNKKYFKIDQSDFTIRSKRVRLWFGDLFDGVPNLGENMNKFLNENWREIIGELNGTISNALGLGIKEVANNLFQRIPVTQLYT